MQSVFEVVIDQRICMVSGESFPVDMYAETHCRFACNLCIDLRYRVAHMIKEVHMSK